MPMSMDLGQVQNVVVSETLLILCLPLVGRWVTSNQPQIFVSVLALFSEPILRLEWEFLEMIFVISDLSVQLLMVVCLSAFKRMELGLVCVDIGRLGVALFALVVTRIDVLRYRYMVVDSDSSLVLL